jgi:hypothetical protein
MAYPINFDLNLKAKQRLIGEPLNWSLVIHAECDGVIREGTGGTTKSCGG